VILIFLFAGLLYILTYIKKFLRQGNPILGVHLYLYSNDVKDVPCSQGLIGAPREGALCHAVSGADGKFSFRSIPCGKLTYINFFTLTVQHYCNEVLRFHGTRIPF
jgi:hypothetical protein